MSDIFIARQPIYTQKLDVHAYELLYRSDSDNYAKIVDGEDATSQVFINALINIGLPELVGKARAFINCTERYLVEGLPAPIVPTQVVLEVLEDILPSDNLSNGLQKLRDAGYHIALDDFIYDETKRSLVERADLIKVDVLGMSEDQIEEQVNLLREFNVPLLAEKVETQEIFTFCNEIGFQYFQGYFFCRPNIIKGKHTPSSKLSILHLLGKIRDPNLEFKELEILIVRDVTLSYRILRYINSAMYNMPRQIESIHRAITLLGLNTIKSWITILAMSNVDDKPYELMNVALVRAKMCESLATSIGSSTEEAFTVGLFSTLDALMDQHFEDLLPKLPLAENVNGALLDHTGPLGKVLKATLAYEKGDWDVALSENFDPDTLRNAYLGAIKWAKETSQSLMAN